MVAGPSVRVNRRRTDRAGSSARTLAAIHERAGATELGVHAPSSGNADPEGRRAHLGPVRRLGSECDTPRLERAIVPVQCEHADGEIRLVEQLSASAFGAWPHDTRARAVINSLAQRCPRFRAIRRKVGAGALHSSCVRHLPYPLLYRAQIDRSDWLWVDVSRSMPLRQHSSGTEYRARFKVLV